MTNPRVNKIELCDQDLLAWSTLGVTRLGRNVGAIDLYDREGDAMVAIQRTAMPTHPYPIPIHPRRGIVAGVVRWMVVNAGRLMVRWFGRPEPMIVVRPGANWPAPIPRLLQEAWVSLFSRNEMHQFVRVIIDPERHVSREYAYKSSVNAYLKRRYVPKKPSNPACGLLPISQVVKHWARFLNVELPVERVINGYEVRGHSILVLELIDSNVDSDSSPNKPRVGFVSAIAHFVLKLIITCLVKALGKQQAGVGAATFRKVSEVNFTSYAITVFYPCSHRDYQFLQSLWVCVHTNGDLFRTKKYREKEKSQ